MADRWRYAHVRGYLRFCREMFRRTAAGESVRFEYGGRAYDVQAWRESFRKALDRRITLKAGPELGWRKLDDQYQTALQRDCRAIRDHATRRLAVHRLGTPELRRRFGHIISGYDD
jgi:hypothetical protein